MDEKIEAGHLQVQAKPLTDLRFDSRSRTVPKIVPSGGLYGFVLSVCESGYRTNQSKFEGLYLCGARTKPRDSASLRLSASYAASLRSNSVCSASRYFAQVSSCIFQPGNSKWKRSPIASVLVTLPMGFHLSASRQSEATYQPLSVR